MITREQVADLQPGDVVEYAGHRDLRGAKLIGPLVDRGGLYIADYAVRDSTGNPAKGGPWGDPTLAVVSRAPRPLYVNHTRTEPVPGDVVRNADSEYPDDQRTWMLDAGAHYPTPWRCGFIGGSYTRNDLPDRLRLLVDGETGQVVQ